MRQALTLGLAGLLGIAPALRGQAPERSPTFLMPTLAMSPRTGATDSTLTMAAIPQGRLGDVRVSKVSRIVTFTLVGAVVGGALGYYSYKEPGNSPCVTSTCDEAREPRMIKGALIGGSLGLTIGVISTLGAGRVPTLAMRSGR